MSLEQSLFAGRKVRLEPVDREQDAPVESRWSHDLEFQNLLVRNPARPYSAAQLKKHYAAWEKQSAEQRNLFHFMLHALPPSPEGATRLVGFARIDFVNWSNGSARIQLGIADPADRRQGLGRESLQLLLRFAFAELNLFRLTACVPDYNLPAKRLLEQAGFQEEVRRRARLLHQGTRWDLLHLGLLRSEWEAAHE